MTPVARVIQSALVSAFGLAGGRRLLQEPRAQGLFVTLYFIYKRWLEAAFVEALARRVVPGSTVLDVGANVGFFTRRFATAVGPHGVVVAVEPDPTNAALLRKAVARWRSANITVLEAAFAERSGHGVLYVSASHMGDHRIFPGDASRECVGIRALAADDYLADTTLPAPLSLVKIDVQGAELRVLRGMAQTLERSPETTLLVEYDPDALAAAGDSAPALLEFLVSRDFRPHLFARGRDFVAVDADALAPARWTGRYTDVLFIRSAR